MPAPDDTLDASPRYLQIARDLKAAIAGGRYALGDRLPTEAELCAQLGISRFTAREAVRVLVAAGLVTRRQRIGSVVTALPDDARYSQASSSLHDLLQYAQDTELRLAFVGKVPLSRAQARTLDAKPGEEWVYAMGLRAVPGEAAPICITRLWLNPLLKGIEMRLRGRRTAVYALIESDYGIGIERVEQELQAVLLDGDDAANLGATAGSAALRVLRRYYDDRGRLLELAENVHPSDRFSYRMQLHR